MASQSAADLRATFQSAPSIPDLESKAFRQIVQVSIDHVQTEEDMRVKLAGQVAAVGLAAVLGQSKDDVDKALVSHEMCRWARRVLARLWVAKSAQEAADGLRQVERDLRRDMVNRAGREYSTSLFGHACLRVSDRADVLVLDYLAWCIDLLGVSPRVSVN